MIKTEYKINFEIDDDSFALIVREPNLKERKELELKASEQKQKLEALELKGAKANDLSVKISSKSEEVEINKELISASALKDKIPLLLENKKLVRELETLKTELATINASLKDFGSLNDELESVFEFKSSLLIYGDDSARFIECVKNKGLSHRLIWENLSVAIAKEQEKK